MGILGIFLRGAAAGIVGLGVLSWLLASREDDDKAYQSESACETDEED